MVSIPEVEPLTVRAGETWAWKRTDLSGDYPASTWTLKYFLKNSASHIEITASADSENFSISVPAATTDGYTAGVYSWVASVEKGIGGALERYQVRAGTIEVLTKFASTSAYDNRSHAKKVLDAIEAVVLGRASLDQMAVTVAGKTLSRTPIADLIVLRDKYKAEYEAEQIVEKIKRGLNVGGNVRIRF